MFTVRKENGIDVEITLEELRGERREDGRFVVYLKDGSKGILMRQAELDEERKSIARELNKFFTLKEGEEPDKRSGLEILMEEWSKPDS